MENRELIYEMADRLGMVIEVYKDDKYFGSYKVIKGKVYKLKENDKEMPKVQEKQTSNGFQEVLANS